MLKVKTLGLDPCWIRINLKSLLWAVGTIVNEQRPRLSLLNLGMAENSQISFTALKKNGGGIVLTPTWLTKKGRQVWRWTKPILEEDTHAHTKLTHDETYIHIYACWLLMHIIRDFNNLSAFLFVV